MNKIFNMKKILLAIAVIFLTPAVIYAATVVFPNRGGTGTNTIPTSGQVLVGQADGKYAPQATSTLGFSAGAVDVLSNVATDRILGRTTAGTGDSEQLTASEVRTLINVEDDSDKTDTANVTSAGALMDSEATDLAALKAIDQSLVNGASPVFATTNMTDASNKRFVTDAQEAKVDHITVTQAVNLDDMETDIAALANGMVYKGDWDASAGTFPGAAAAQIGWFYYVSVAGTVDSVSFAVGDNIIAVVDDASTSTYASNWSKHDQTDAVQAVVGLTGSVAKGSLLAALNVEDGADVTDTANVTSAGALMDLEVDNLAQVKAFDTSDYATAAQGSTADNALPKAGGTMTGNIALNGNYLSGDGDDEGVFVAASGNVGIGTTSPGIKLHVYSTIGNQTKGGTAVFENNQNYGSGIKVKMTGNSHGSYFGYDLENSSGNSVFTVSNNGTIAAVNLELSGSFSPSKITQSGNFDGYSGTFTNSNSFAQGISVHSNNSHSTKNALLLTSTAGDLLAVRNNGNVGIGLTDPGEKLSVAGNVMIGDSAWSDGTTTGDLAIQGNVGIGTTDPDTKLHVAGAITQQPLSSDPADPDAGNSVQWVSDGTGTGDAGDVMLKVNVGGTTKIITLIDYSIA